MKTDFQRLLTCAWLALALSVAVRAQSDTPAPTPAASSATQTSAAASTPSSTVAEPSSAASDKPAVAPADTRSTVSEPTATPAAANTETAVAPASAAAPAAPAAEAAPAAPAGDQAAATESAESTETSTATSTLRTLATTEETAPAAPAAPAPETPKKPRHRRASGDNARVTIFGNSHLNKDEEADAVVSIGGNSTSEGDVHGPVIAIGGNSRATGPVYDVVLAVLGNVYVDSRVGQVVAVMGNVELGPNAEVQHDVVCIGGAVHRDPKAIVHGNIPNVGVGHAGFHVEWLQSYVSNCILKGRPLAIAPHLAWAWFIALGFLVFYVLIALLFGRTVERNCETLEQYPGASLLAAVLTLLLAPIVIVLLCVIVVGVVVVPFLAIGLMLASLFGRVVMLAWLGRRLTGFTGGRVHPALAVLVGGVVMLALYLIPFFGFIVYKLTGVLGLGVVVYSIILASRREKAARLAAAAAAAAAVPPPVAVPPTTSAGYAFPGGEMPAMAAAGAAAGVAPAPTPPVAGAAVPPVALTALPRAGFWVRLGAMLIDVILVAAVVGIINSNVPHFLHTDGPGLFLILTAVYAAVLWKLRGTTIGGIVCGLRVVRTDGREIDWATAFVRGAGCFLSLVVAFLGFIWVAFDDERQSWHDKIAGTTVVHSRGNVSLV